MPQSASAPGLAGAAVPLDPGPIDRDHLSRARPALFDELLAAGDALVLPMREGRVPLDEAGDGLELFDPGRVTAALVRVYLGRARTSGKRVEAGTPLLAEVLTPAAAHELQPDETRWVPLRQALSRLGALERAVAIEAVAITNWHGAGEYCPRCGMPTVVEQAGWVRRCFTCERELFPRTDAAVIVAVRDGEDRLLLGSNAMWEPNRWSVLAGFVEPGETLEQAAAREMSEEASVRIATAEYAGSQPWPFPASLMVGFRARLADGERAADVTPDGEEILALRWYSRSALWQERAGLLLPGPGSIARALIEDWYGGPVDAPPAARG